MADVLQFRARPSSPTASRAGSVVSFNADAKTRAACVALLRELSTIEDVFSEATTRKLIDALDSVISEARGRICL